MENRNQQQTTRSGNLNPMYGKKQSYETKKKISDSQKERLNCDRNSPETKALLPADHEAGFCFLFRRIAG